MNPSISNVLAEVERILAGDPSPSEFDCPRCTRGDGYLNIYKNVCGVCHSCRVTWPLGWGIFSTWMKETPADWERNRALLVTYEKVHH